MPKADTQVAQHCGVCEVSLPPRDGQLGAKVTHDGIRQAQIPLAVLKINRIHLRSSSTVFLCLPLFQTPQRVIICSLAASMQMLHGTAQALPDETGWANPRILPRPSPRAEQLWKDFWGNCS